MREAGLNLTGTSNVGDPRIVMEEEERKVGMKIFSFPRQFHQLFLHPNHRGFIFAALPWEYLRLKTFLGLNLMGMGGC